MDVGHAVIHHPPNFFQALVRSHCADSVALHEYVAAGQQLEGLQGGAIGTEDSLPSFDEAVFVRDLVPDLDDVAGHTVFEDFDGLWGGDAAGEEFDKVSSVENGCRVVGLSCRLDGPVESVVGQYYSHVWLEYPWTVLHNVVSIDFWEDSVFVVRTCYLL